MTVASRRWRIAHSEASTGWGGQEHRVLAELRGFQRRGCEVRLIAPRASVIFQRADAAGIPVLDVNFARPRFPLDALRLARWLRREKIQVLNPHSSRDGWLLGVAGRLAGVPLIIRTRHIDVDYPNTFSSGIVFKKLADHVLTTSDKITAHFQKIFQIPADRITTLPTGIDLELFSPEGGRVELPGKESGYPLVGMVSVLRSWKGHTTFLEAAAKLKSENFPARFVIVGDGPIRANIEKKIAELQIGDVVTLAGHREDVPAVLRTLDVLCIPSTKHEGVPQIGLQALACKTAVVGSDVGGIPEIIRDGETGRIFPANNSEALAAAIRTAISDKAMTKAMTENGRMFVEKNFSIDRMLDRLEELYAAHIKT
ncbi:MAG TPA: glycosyltransferase family 4 protein [Candidatus Sulfotelmatobacter sp.]|jgi:glycosyltransferase involved in cell wall biosynthesis|nr:glycosyltransferase family 4 protein [Candidatus Sulfotelmatobacter sp.]